MCKNINKAIVSVIIERYKDGKKQILVMTRWKPHRDPKYSGTLEIPAGHVDYYENVYEAAKREVFEETGLTVTEFIPNIKTKTHSPQNDGAFAFVPFCCQQQVKNGQPWLGFVFICRAKEGKLIPREGETKDVRWIDCDALKRIFENHPERIFTLQLGVLDFYFNHSR